MFINRSLETFSFLEFIEKVVHRRRIWHLIDFPAVIGHVISGTVVHELTQRRSVFRIESDEVFNEKYSNNIVSTSFVDRNS